MNTKDQIYLDDDLDEEVDEQELFDELVEQREGSGDDEQDDDQGVADDLDDTPDIDGDDLEAGGDDNDDPSLEDQLKALQDKNTQLEHQFKSESGRQSALQQQLKEAKDKLDGLSKKESESTQAVDQEKWDRIKEDYPEIADALDARMGGEIRSLREKVSSFDGMSEQLEQERQSLAQQREQDKQERVANALLERHPDAFEISSTDDFKEWVTKQPAYIQIAVSDSKDPNDASDVLDKYKAFKSPAETDAEKIQRKRKEKLRSNQSIPSRGKAAQDLSSSDEEAIFNEYAKKVDSVRR